MAYVLFISQEKLVDSTAINLAVDPEILLPYILQAQRIYCEPKLGTPLYQKLEAEITAGTLAGAYKTLVDEYIGLMLPSWAFHMCIPFLRFKVENGNIYSKTSETGTALSTEEAQHLREEVRNNAEYFTERMIEYITNNLTSFPEYGTASGADISADRNAYYNGMNLEKPTPQGTKLTLRNFLTAGE
tara:strand:- start:264 stop:824 length:561 start_codon:yes stop_codon:yes gene_type:complete